MIFHQVDLSLSTVDIAEEGGVETVCLLCPSHFSPTFSAVDE